MVFEQQSMNFSQPVPVVYSGIYTKIDWYSAMFEDMSFMDVLRWLKLDVYVSDFLIGMRERLSGFDEMFVFSYEGINLETRQFNFFGDQLSENCFEKKIPKIRLDISGSGLEFLRSTGMDPDVYLRQEENIPQPFHCTRCDFAYDLINYKPEFLDQLIDYARNHHTAADRLCVYKLNTGIKYSIRTGGQKTIYLGASTSDKMLRVYDKRLQFIDPSTQVYKKQNPYNNPDSWIRIELQTRNKTAHGLCYGKGDMLSIFRYVYETYQFSDVENTTQHNRRPAAFWQDLFDWEQIPRIIQNANSDESVTPYKDRVTDSFFARNSDSFMLVYTRLGPEEFARRLNAQLSKKQDLYDSLNKRRWSNYVDKMNMFGFEDLHLNEYGLKLDGGKVGFKW